MIFFLIFLAFLLRIINLNQSLWLDEASQAILSSGSIHSIIFDRADDFHPPLSYLLTHFWMLVTPNSGEIWLRLLPVLFGTATVAIFFILVNKLFDKKIALISSLFLSFAPYHIYYSQEFRMYSMATFFAVLSMLFFYLEFKKKNLINYCGYILSTLALIYTHYMGFFLIFAQIFFILWVKKDQLTNWIKKMTLVILLYLPWVPLLLQQLKSGLSANDYLPGWAEVLKVPLVKVIPLTFLKFSIGRIDFDNQFIYIIIAATVLSGIGFIFAKGLTNLKENQKLIICWFFVPLTLSILISFKIPIDQPFRLLFILPAFYLILALGVTSLNKFKKIGMFVILGISIIGLSFYYLDPKFAREDWRGATNVINENLSYNSEVIFVWPQPFDPYLWYGGKNALGVIATFPANQSEVNKNMQPLLSKDDIYLFEYLQDLSDPNKELQKWLVGNGFKKGKIYDFRGVGFVDHYQKNTE